MVNQHAIDRPKERLSEFVLLDSMAKILEGSRIGNPLITEIKAAEICENWSIIAGFFAGGVTKIVP